MARRPESRGGDRGCELLVLGLGNVLCADDGVGPVAVARLESEWQAPPGARVVDGGTLGLSLASLVAEAGAVLLLDAVATDRLPAGSLVRFEDEAVPTAVLERLSPHQIGVADLLETLRLLGRLPPKLVLLGIVPQSLELAVERTPAVAAALPQLVEEAVREAARLGHVFRRRAHRAPPTLVDRAGVYGARGV